MRIHDLHAPHRARYPFAWVLAACVLGTAGLPAQAQWLTQSFLLKPGWNGIYLHVDPSHATIEQLVALVATNPVVEVWLWRPSPVTDQFIETPQTPTSPSTQWASWIRTLGGDSDLQRLAANSAYLVRVTGTGDFQWDIKGKPVPLAYQWTSTGLNFLSFPTPASSSPTFEAFLSPDRELLVNAEIYRYVGGPLDDLNPTRLIAFDTTPLPRGEAFWIRRMDGAYNRYFGPFELQLQSGGGADFGESISQYRIRLRNLTSQAFDVTIQLVESEAPPEGQAAIVGSPPLLLRGDLDLSALTYGYSSLNAAPQAIAVTKRGDPGSELDLVLGVNRSQMSAAAGSRYAAILRLTDSLGLSQVDVPVSAGMVSKSGLWVGQASVTQVRQYLKNYERDADGQLVLNPNGSYQITSVNTNLGNVTRAFPLRLILHHEEATGASRLLQRVYYGMGLHGTNVATTTEILLDRSQLATARRISAPHLPWSEANTPWPCSGSLGGTTPLTVTVTEPYDDQVANPFLHTYHPDHDNRNAAFTQLLPRGEESFSLSRDISLTFTPPGNDFLSLTTTSGMLSGTYDESITVGGKGSESRRFDVRGEFQLNRILDVPALTTQ